MCVCEKEIVGGSESKIVLIVQASGLRALIPFQKQCTHTNTHTRTQACKLHRPFEPPQAVALRESWPTMLFFSWGFEMIGNC